MADPLDDGALRAASAAVRAEWRDDEEEWTRAALEHWEHGRTLVDITRDCMHRGDTISLETPHVAVRGVITAVGLDTVRIVDGETTTDVQLGLSIPFVLRVVERSRTGGARSTDESPTFRSRLFEHEAIPVIDLGMFTHGDVLTGELRVAADHVRVRSRGEIDSFVTTSSVAWVRASQL